MESVDRGIGRSPDAVEGDVGFHLGADSLGIPGGHLNVVPGNGQPLPKEYPGISNLNQGSYGKLEKELRNLADIPGNKVKASFEAIYKPGNTSSRPDGFEVTYSVNNGPKKVREFVNQPGG